MTIRKIILMVGLLSYINHMHACVIALTNDSNKNLLIVTDDFKEGMMLPKNEFVEFGSKEYMANFRVMEPNGQHFTQHYHVQQTACTPGKYTKLKMSELTPGNTTIPFNISLVTPKQTPITTNATISTNSGQPKKSDCGCGH